MESTFLIKAIQLILSLSLLVIAHEFGHFGFAKLFKVRVEKFYLFFHPQFTILRFKKINGKWQFKWFAKNAPEVLIPLKDADGNVKTDKKGKTILVNAPIESLPEGDWRRHPETTEWGIGWLPLGGYCKIAGMVDESMDMGTMNSEPQSWEYRAKPAWQRLFIITGGVLVNFVMALVIYGAILFTWGKEELPLQNAYLGMNYSQTALANGFINGDIILQVDGNDVYDQGDAAEKILIEGKQNIMVKRGDSIVNFILPKDFSQRLLEAKETKFMELRFPFVAESIVQDMPAEEINMQANDSIVGINGIHSSAFQDIAEQLNNNKGKRVDITYYRNGELISDSIRITEDGKLGINLMNPFNYFKTVKREYSFLASIPAGMQMGWDTLTSYIKQFRLVFTKEGAQSLGGFGTIGSLFPSVWNWEIFWSMTALLSVVLAFMNILPIPILDGGYVLFIIYEMITGKKPSDKFMEISLTIGMVLLFGLLIFANGNDIIRFFIK